MHGRNDGEAERALGLGGGALLVVAGACSLAIADGSPVLFLGMPGYLAFLVWTVATGLRLAFHRIPHTMVAPS